VGAPGGKGSKGNKRRYGGKRKLAPFFFKPPADLKSPNSILLELKEIVKRLLQIEKIIGTNAFGVKVHRLQSPDLERIVGVQRNLDGTVLADVVDDFMYLAISELDSRDIASGKESPTGRLKKSGPKIQNVPIPENVPFVEPDYPDGGLEDEDVEDIEDIDRDDVEEEPHHPDDDY
jgi:hypothetical protein